MIHSPAEFREWQRWLRIYWGVRRRHWQYGPEGLCRWLYARMIQGRRELNLENPTSFCDKLNWLKLHYHLPEHKTYADKWAVRAHVAGRIGEEWLNPALGLYGGPEEIPWEELLDAFVLKATHGSAMNVICPDKARLDRGLAERRLGRWLRRDFYWYGMEWCYRDLPRRIVCERFLRGEDGQPPWDYKVLCFGGEPRIVWVDVGRHTQHRRAYYDPGWNRLDCGSSWYEAESAEVPRPPELGRMLEAARALAEGSPFMRVDFYLASGQWIFGEITLYPGGGFEPFMPLSYDEEVGGWIQLPEANA